MQAWTCRNITPIGRITILKSLILSKIIHILQSLPSPGTETLNTLDKMNFDFIWKGKRHEVNKKNLCLDWEHGGLNMINLKEFDMSLKITWLRKLIVQDPDWLEFALHYRIDKIIWTGSNFHDSITNIHNPFWNSVKIAFSSWYKVLNTNGKIEIEDQPIWGNSQLNMPVNYDLFNNNILFIKDLFTEQGLPRSKESLEQSIGKNIMFLTFHAILRSLPKQWKDHMLTNSRNSNLVLPPIISLLTCDKKGTKNIRKAWNLRNRDIIPVGQEKWSQEIDNHHLVEWSKIYSLAKLCKMNARIIFFQFQVNHRTLITNRKLFQFGIRDNDHCDVCATTETISHLLYECPNVRELWTELQLWLERSLNTNIFVSSTDILLGNPRNDPVTNCIFLITKHEIYKQKWNRTRLTIHKLKIIIKHHMDLECYLGKIRGNQEKTMGKWASIYHHLQ